MSWFQRARNAIRSWWYPDRLRLGVYEVNRAVENDRLGAGTFGTVWRGKNVQTGAHVAVKQVKKTEETQTFIDREVNLLRMCDAHENIVNLLEHVEKSDSDYFVMEYCQNGNLATFMTNQDLSNTARWNVVKDITSAVRYLHGQRICHRDIKPSNILVRESGSCVLADFGLSRVVPHSASPATLTACTGTVEWMAPEVLRERYGPPVDIYSLGLVTLAVFKQQPGERLEAHKEGRSHLLHWMDAQKASLTSLDDPSYNCVIPSVKTLVLKMIRYDPDDRLTIDSVQSSLATLTV